MVKNFVNRKFLCSVGVANQFIVFSVNIIDNTYKFKCMLISTTFTINLIVKVQPILLISVYDRLGSASFVLTHFHLQKSIGFDKLEPAARSIRPVRRLERSSERRTFPERQRAEASDRRSARSASTASLVLPTVMSAICGGTCEGSVPLSGIRKVIRARRRSPEDENHLHRPLGANRTAIRAHGACSARGRAAPPRMSAGCARDKD